MTVKSIFRSTGAVLACLAMLLAASQAQSADEVAAKPKKAKTTKSVKTAKVAKVKFMPGSQETTAERVARLKRECKGRVNAGACEGYTN
ncbi:hypothetical protein [Polaromonas sp.]|uniref:hypothetical protein n=1 Tax=Polaromonas sp. TaxID=1869339 RepID=UPI002FC76476